MRILAAALSLLLASAPYAEAARFIAPKIRTNVPASGANVRVTLPLLGTNLNPTLNPELGVNGLPLLNVNGAPVVAVAQALPGVLPAAEQAWNGATAEQSATLNQNFAELNAHFESKDPGTVDGGSLSGGSSSLGSSSEKGNDDESQGPPKPPKEDGPAPSRGWFGFSRGVAFLLLATGIAQIGVEAQAAAMPTLLAKIFGNVSVSADLGILSSVTDIVGTMIAPAVINKVGLKKTFVAATLVRLAGGGVLAGLVAAGMLTVPVMMAVFGVTSLAWGISYTAERSMPAVLLNQDQSKMERFRGARQIMIEVVATLVPIGTGALVASVGFMPAMIAFPVALAASVAIVAWTLDVPEKLKTLSEAPRSAGVTSFFKSLGRGVAVVSKTPALAWSLLSFSFYWLMNPMLYWLVAPAFGIWVGGSEEKGAFISGILTGVFSLGGLLGGLMITRFKPKDMRQSMLKWMDATTLSVLLFGLFAFGSTPLAAFALLVFGTAQVMAKIKIESYFQASVPGDAINDATAAMDAFSLVLTTAGLYALKLIFAGDAPGQDAFIWLAALMVPLAATYFFLRRGLAKASKP
jgi:hypothetical protein